MRQIVFDTESTGLDFNEDRVIEIGALEVINYIPTGKTYHQYINPEDRPVSEGAFAVHGISNERLADEPVFSQIFTDFLEFVDDADLVAHNADFDMRFINAELKRVGVKPIHKSRAIDTLAIARKKFPGANNTLDALCRRYNVDASERVLHGALLDAELLAEVYLELSGGRQQGLSLDAKAYHQENNQMTTLKNYPPRVFDLPQDEMKKFQLMLSEINEPLWQVSKKH